MPVIYLRKQSPYEADQGIKVTVRCEAYDHCKLFQRYKHELKPPTRGCIYVFKQRWSTTTYIALAPSCKYSCAKLEHVDVYFNKHENTKPLLFVLHFQNGDAGVRVENRYYPRSKFEGEMTSCATKKIEELCNYSDEPSILCALIQENDTLPGLLTYDIMQRPNGGGTPCTYNGDKINVTNATTNGSPKLGNGFKVYKHQPNNNGAHKTKNACIVYNCQALLKDGGDELEGVQGEIYTCIKVYFGGKAKRACTQKGQGTTCTKGECAGTPGEPSKCPTAASAEQTCTQGNTDPQDVPLMIALQRTNGGDAQPDYYVHRRKATNGDTYYWVKLENNGQENGNGELKQLLAEIGLSPALSGGARTSVKSRLGQPANGVGQTTYLTILLRRLEFDLTSSVIILLDKTKDNGSDGYGDTDITSAIGNLQPTDTNKWINPLKLSNGHNIQVTDAGGQNTCLTKHKYRVVVHDFNQAVSGLGQGCSAGLRFLMPTSGNGGDSNDSNKYAQLSLYPGDTQTSPANLEYKYYQNGGTGAQNGTKVYVVFYKGDGTGTGDSDPRPLLLCYQKEVYRPKGKTEYEQTWVKVTGVKKCFCQNGGSETSNGADDKLLGAVTGVVGFLNTVNLYNHPGGPSTSAGSVQACSNSGVSGATCQTATSTTTCSSCTYEVHRYNNQPIKVQVTCEAVPSTPGSQSCYKKLTHQPGGMKGPTSSSGNGFRLGDVEYCRNGGPSGPSGKRTGSIKYYPNGSSGGQNNTASPANRWAPLKSVYAYFYNADTKYCDPLLVVLEFAKVTPANGVTGTEKECYKLTKSNGDQLEWANDPDAAKSLVGPDQENGELVKHLDGIRYCLKKVVRIHLEFNGTGTNKYPLVGREAKPGKGEFNQKINGQEVTVEVVPCPALSSNNYKCVKHDLTTALEGKHDKVAGLAFTLPGTENKVIEIPLAEGASVQGSEVTFANGSGPANGQTAKIIYNQCMGDIYVYFYDGSRTTVKPAETDTVPLMLRYNGQFYKPETRDSYFTKWVCVPTLAELTGDCGCAVSGAGDHGTDCQQLVKQLDTVNLALNRIDLDKSSAGGYGLPEESGGGGTTGYKLDDKVGNVRVKVVTQTPSGDGKTAYERIIHRTTNGFQIGDIKYGGQEIVANGVKVNGSAGVSGDATIRIANGGKNHKDHVNSSQWNTVAAYYSTTDGKKQLPQLIVILKTDGEVKSGEHSVTGSINTAYGYYVLATQSGVGSGSEYEYKWVDVSGKKASGVELNDETDFKLLNAAVLLVDQQAKTYGDEDIKKAIETANLKSPGNSEGVNRMTGNNRNITVTDETTSTDGGAVTHTCPCKCKCLKDAGFKVMSHDLKDLVELSGFKSPPCEVRLITGLRFLIPSMYRENSYNEIKLCSNGSGTSCSMEDRHYYRNRENKICVYFYGSDPRPLLVCYDNWAYSPKTLNGYFTDWHKAEGVTKCGCDQTPLPKTCDKCPVVSELVRVSDFLNPVKLQVLPSKTKPYTIHWFNTQPIRIKVEEQKATDKFCFDRFTHTHAGIYGDGKGFRLGDIYHGKNCIKLNGASTNTGTADKCISASDVQDPKKLHRASPEVVVYYYRRDDNHEHPLLVALRKPDQDTAWDGKHQPYFELKAKVEQGQQKEYTKKTDSDGLDLSNTGPEGDLAKKLDSILFAISIKLQVVLAERPVPKLYSVSFDIEDKEQKYKVVWLRPEKFKQESEQHKREYEKRKKEFEKQNKQYNPEMLGRSRDMLSRMAEGTQESLFYHDDKETKYQAQLCDPESTKPVSSSSSQTAITVREIDCSTIYSQGGYRCFQHRLMSAEGIEQVGGLKLAVFDGKGGQGKQATESYLTLCTGYTAGKTQPVELRYTTCKGDLYVF